MKITRDAFLYLPPSGKKDQFAQCGTCEMWVKGDDRCLIHGPKIEVPADASCGFYVPGKPRPKDTKTRAAVTPEESGLVEREVRCENCRFFNQDCGLFKLLNRIAPALFDLDPSVDAKGCCNAQTPADNPAAAQRIGSLLGPTKPQAPQSQAQPAP